VFINGKRVGPIAAKSGNKVLLMPVSLFEDGTVTGGFTGNLEHDGLQHLMTTHTKDGLQAKNMVLDFIKSASDPRQEIKVDLSRLDPIWEQRLDDKGHLPPERIEIFKTYTEYHNFCKDMAAKHGDLWHENPKKVLSAEEYKRFNEIKTRRNQAALKSNSLGASSHTPVSSGRHEFGKAVVHVGERVVAMYAAGWVGQQFQDWEKARKQNGLGPLMGVSDNTSYALRKADQLAAGAGIAIMGGGMVMAVPRVAAKVGATQGGRVVAKSIPVVGTVLGIYYAGRRAWDGDWTGVGLELASAGMDIVSAAGVLTGPGEVGIMSASISLDASIAARDGLLKNGECALAMVDGSGNPITMRDENGAEVPVLGARINYKHDVRQGEALFYDIGKNGSYLALRGEYKNDKRTGEWVRQGPNKEKLEVAHYKDGVLVGEYRRADKNGRLLVKANFTSGKYVSYWPDENGLSTGMPSCVGEIKGGHCVGVWSMYDKDGMLSKEIDYETNIVRE
jgi:hypothetical protein